MLSSWCRSLSARAQGSSLVGSGVENPDTDFRLGLTYQGATTMEVYLNGVSQGEVSLTI